MDDYLRAALLGLIQALTEFLPISSSGHLVLAAELLGDEVNTLTFDVGLHLGTTVAVLVYFARDWALIAVSAQRDVRTHGLWLARWRWRSRLGVLLAIASLPAVLVGAVLQLAVDDGLRDPLVVGVALIAGAVAMWVLDGYGESRGGLRVINGRRALVIGVAQAAALVPGVSRSGAAISAARGFHLTRYAAARFSFLLSAPIVVGAEGVLVLQVLRGGEDIAWGPLLLGAAVAAVAGLFVIRGLLRFVRRRSLRVFVWYRLALGAAVLAGVWAGAF
ncbi:MAG: undecaprenyl-diphosphate phosphatase [Chloroflexi bacterium]|nr:undecaprenyl-diphosphate phosphatase [Chloroflexota bacterium]